METRKDNKEKEAEKVIRGKCREVGVVPDWVNLNASVIEPLIGDLLYLSFKTVKTNYKIEMWMRGKHQWTNANLAIHLAETLRDFNFKISKENIETGIETTRHKGRLEYYKNILFDGAHNIAGAKALREYLDEFIKQPITMVFGAMRDKDLAQIASILFPKADKLILTVPGNLRSLKVDELRRFVPEDFPDENLYFSDDPAVVLTMADFVSEGKNLILITGSLYLVGEMQKFLKNQTEV